MAWLSDRAAAVCADAHWQAAPILAAVRAAAASTQLLTITNMMYYSGGTVVLIGMTVLLSLAWRQSGGGLVAAIRHAIVLVSGRTGVCVCAWVVLADRVR